MSEPQASPLLNPDQILQWLADQAGGGGTGSPLGAAAGARWAAGKVNRVVGDQLLVPLPPSVDTLHRLRWDLFVGQAREFDGPVPGTVILMGRVMGGAMKMNPCLVQCRWHPEQLWATAHALEGLINQRTATKVLAQIRDILSKPAPAPGPPVPNAWPDHRSGPQLGGHA